MKFLILIGIIVSFYSVSCLKFKCDVLDQELLSKNVVNIFIMHSYMITNNNSFDKNLSTSLKFPINRPSYALPKIHEHLYGSEFNYSIVFNDSFIVGTVPVAGIKTQLSPKFRKTCADEKLVERFAVIFIVEEPASSILLYGCNIKTGKNVIIAMLESKTSKLTIPDLVMIDLNNGIHLFQTYLDDNKGFCLCNATRRENADCLKRNFQAKNRDSFINNMFYIYIGITFVMITILYVIHRVTCSSDET